MILKLMKSPNGVWQMIDNIAQYLDYGAFYGPEVNGERKLALVSNNTELNPLIKEMWGDQDFSEFSTVAYPEWHDGYFPTTVHCLRMVLRDGKLVLVFANLSTYILNDHGDTIEKIRG
jgi:hypothetical protein